MGLLKDIPWLFTEIEKDNKDESDIPPWMKNSRKSNVEKSEKIKSKLEIEEEKYLESIFEGKKNEFNSIFSTINGTNIDESPEEKLKKFIWLNFNMENFYLDDNVGIEKNIAVELFLTDEEIKNGTTKIVKYEKTELISKYNYINETEEMKKFMKEIYTE